MSYMWEEFNIKTFAAETLVYRDGAYCPDLSTLGPGAIDKTYDLPVHIIYVGEIAGKNELNIDISAGGQQVFLSARIKNKKPAFLNIFIKNTGKNSELRGHVMMQNDADLTFECRGHHAASETGILIKSKLIAGVASKSKLSAAAVIDPNCADCTSDIGFSALCAPDARIEFTPAQYISAVPHSASHGAALYRPTPPQIEFLRGAGLSGAEVDVALREAFMNDFPLF